jgi:hypothetical protein
VDHLALLFRYVLRDRIHVERFLSFLDNVGRKSEDIKDAVLSIVNVNCKGQSYENASMSRVYSGLQVRLKYITLLALYVPCAPHCLNLVGKH